MKNQWRLLTRTKEVIAVQILFKINKNIISKRIIFMIKLSKIYLTKM
jgi:hypothetical protein